MPRRRMMRLPAPKPSQPCGWCAPHGCDYACNITTRHEDSIGACEFPTSRDAGRCCSCRPPDRPPAQSVAEAESLEGNQILEHRQPLPFVVDTNEPVRLNIVMTGLGEDLTGGPLSIMHFAQELVRHGRNVRWLNADGRGINGSRLFSQPCGTLSATYAHAQGVSCMVNTAERM